jgi:hypothetical protein
MIDREQIILDQAIHELRNIFCIVIGNLELLRDPAYLTSQKAITRMLNSTQRFEDVIAALSELGSSHSSD